MIIRLLSSVNLMIYIFTFLEMGLHTDFVFGILFFTLFAVFIKGKMASISTCLINCYDL